MASSGHPDAPHGDVSSPNGILSAPPLPEAPTGPAAADPAARAGGLPPVKLNIVIMSMGTRGDLKPHLEIAKLLAHRCGHNVRFAVYPRYRDIVEEAGIEFYSIGKADPFVMSQRRLLSRKEMQPFVDEMKGEFLEMGRRWWGASIGDPVGLGRDGPQEKKARREGVQNEETGTDGSSAVTTDGLGQEDSPFVADAVISMFQAYDHTSIAATLGIPLHMIGTNARTSSKHIPHSQAEGFAKGEGKIKNKMSYWLQDLFFFQYMKEYYNIVRVGAMGLEPFTPIWQLTQYNRMRVPMTYCWSPALMAKAPDWGSHINVGAFIFHEEPDWTPPADLTAFLDAESDKKTIYVGFGSMMLPQAEENNKAFAEVFAAVEKAGVRAVVARGWSRFDVPTDKPDSIFVIDEAPHAWLFPRVSAVVIHCGAGTLAMALKTGKPIVPVPFKGDQPFWSHHLWKVGCATTPLPIREITADKLAENIKEIIQNPKYAEVAQNLAAEISHEAPGQELFVRDALQTFSIYEREGRCDIVLDRPAVWKHSVSGAKLSAVAAHLLVREKRIRQSDLQLLYVIKWPDYISPGDPFTGLIKAVGRVLSSFGEDGKRISASFGAPKEAKKEEAGQDLDRGDKHDNGGAVQTKNGNDLQEQPVHSPPVALLLGILFILFHLLRAPLTIFVGLAFGLYNFIDWIIYELGSRFEPDLFASNPRVYSLPQMIGFLLLKFPSELASIATGPGHVVSQGRSIGRAILEVPMALLRALLAALNIVVGVLALPLRAIDIELSRAMGERPKNDVVKEARIRQGRLEAQRREHAAVEEGGGSLRETVAKGWDEKFGRS